MTTTTTSPEFIHTLSLTLNAAVSVARAQHAVNAEKQDTANPEDSVAARHLGTLTAQFDSLCNDLYLLATPGPLDAMLDELDDAITCGDVDAAEKIRDRELALHSPEVARVRDIDGQIKSLEAQINLLRTKMDELEEERAQNAVTAVWSGFTKDQLAEATDRSAADVNCWLLGV